MTDYKFVRAFTTMESTRKYADMLRDNGYQAQVEVRYDTDSDYMYYLYAREA